MEEQKNKFCVPFFALILQKRSVDCSFKSDTDRYILSLDGLKGIYYNLKVYLK